MKEQFKAITDKDLTVFLVAKGFTIAKVLPEAGRNRCLIYFEATKELEEAVLNYTNKSDVINYPEYIAAEKRVRTLLNVHKS